MVITHLAYASIRKKKTPCAALILFVLLAVTFMNIGSTLISESAKFYDKKEKSTNGAQFIAICEANNYKKALEEFIFKDERVAEAEKEEVIFLPSTKNNKNKSEQGAFIFNSDEERQIAPLSVIDEDKSIPKDIAIYVPISLKDNNFSVGDDFILSYKNINYSFKIAGFFETSYFSSAYSGYYKYFVKEDAYEKLYSEVGRAVILSARFKEEGKDKESIIQKFTKDFVDKTDINYISRDIMNPCFNSVSMKYSCMLMFNMFAAILIAFAFVICVIVMIVIYNHVSESIDENIQNIGALQAIGYTRKQIMLAMIFEFMLLSIVGAVLGTAVAYAVMQLMSKLVNSTGLMWIFSFHVQVDIVCFGIIELLLLFTTLFSTMKIYKLPPVKALRKNIETHHFAKNIFPLHKGFASVNFGMGVKNFFYNIKSNAAFTIIIAGGTFAMGLIIIIYMNFAYDKTAMYKMVGFELSDLQIKVTENTDTKKFADKLSEMDEVRKTNLSDITNGKLENIDVSFIVSDNFNAMEVLSVYEGTFPRYDNEIAITGVMSKQLHKTIGDNVKVTAEGKSKEYLITGIYQTTNNSGLMSIITFDGIKKLRPQYEMKKIDIYLKDGIDKEKFKEKLRQIYKVAVKDDKLSGDNDEIVIGKYSEAKKAAEEKIARLLSDYGVNSVSYSVMLNGEIILSGDSSAYKIKEIADLHDYLSGQLNSYAGIMSGMVKAMVLITLLIIGGILTITIKSIIRRKREEYGILKALGYTTLDLVKQLSLGFAFTSIIGTLIGTLTIILFSNNIFQLLFYGMGLTKVNIIINPVLLLIMDICITIYVYFLAMFKAYKIKKITVYELLTE